MRRPCVPILVSKDSLHIIIRQLCQDSSSEALAREAIKGSTSGILI